MENVEDRLSRRRAPLVLPSLVLEGVTNTDVDVGEALLGGLTITGTPTPTIMTSSSASSSAWLRVPGPPIGAGTRSMGSRNDAVSVLTTHTVPAGITGRVVLGGALAGASPPGIRGGFSELSNHSKMPAHSGDGKFKLLKIEPGDGRCLGFVGKSRDIVCVNKKCAVGIHSKASSKWDPKANTVYLIGAIKQGASATAFIVPSAVLVADGLPSWLGQEADMAKKTLKEWMVDFMPNARQQAMECLPIPEELEDEDASMPTGEQFEPELDTSGLDTVLAWEAIELFQYTPFKAEEEINRADDGPFAVELRQSIVELRENLQQAREEARAELIRISTVVEESSGWFADTLSSLSKSGARLQESVGDAAAYSAMYAVGSLSQGLQLLHEHFEDAQEAKSEAFVGILARMDELDEDMNFIDTDVGTIANGFSDVLGHVNTLTNRMGTSASAAPISPSVLSTSSVIVDALGQPLTSVGDLLSKLNTLVTENARLSAMVGSQGGLTVGSFTFPSIDALAEVIDRELTGVYPWDIFVDVSTMHIHNANVDPGNAASLLDWNKATKEMAGTYSVAQRKYVRAIIQPVSSLYTDGKEVFPGGLAAAFKTAATWTGANGRHGSRHKIEDQNNTARLAVLASIDAQLARGSVLHALALHLVERTTAWNVELHRHIDSELNRLTQMGLNKDAVLVLLTEEVLILFKLVHNVRKTGQAFSMSTDPKDFMLQCLWVTLGCHAAMEEGVKNGISTNGAINSAFVSFLTEAVTKVTGGSVDSKLENWKTTLERKVNEAVEMAKQAKTNAAAAQGGVEKLKSDLASKAKKP